MVDKLEKARELIAAVYQHNPVGGNLHVQLDDENLEDEYFKEFDPTWMEGTEEQLAVEKECFDFLKTLSYEERCRALGFDPEG